MTTQPQDPLVALAWHGGLTPLRDYSAYYGRYADQDLFPSAAVNALIEQGYAEAQDSSEALRSVFPTRAGLEEALRRAPPEREATEKVLAVIGTREWEVSLGERPALAGLFITEASGAQLIAELAALLKGGRRSHGVHVVTTGGLIPAALTAEMPGTPCADAPLFELAPVPETVAPLVELTRRYRYVLEVWAREGRASLFQWVGPHPRFVGHLPLGALVGMLKDAHASLATLAAEQGLDDELAVPSEEMDDEPSEEAAS